jgi:hypothetical protein
MASTNIPAVKHSTCSTCGRATIVLSLADVSSNREEVSWCEAGHVVVSQQGHRDKTVYEFQPEGEKWDDDYMDGNG